MSEIVSGGRFSAIIFVFKGEDYEEVRESCCSSIVALAWSAGMVPVAMAGGAGKGGFICNRSGVPGWGHMTSSYWHPNKSHYATATGTGYITIQANSNKWVAARTGRVTSDNQCYCGIH